MLKRSERAVKKKEILKKITEIYHRENGVPDYRMMANELKKHKIFLSPNTVYSYMKELNLKSIVRQQYVYHKGDAHKVFANLLERDFSASQPNQKWCADFTYLHLTTGEKRYNCSILDLYDRRIVATLNSNKIDSKLAIDTLKIALKNALLIPRKTGRFLRM